MRAVHAREGDTSLTSCHALVNSSSFTQDQQLVLHSRLQHVLRRKLKRTLLLSLWTLSSIFFVSEPDVASSDATNMECQITREGSEVVINGRKWWSSGKWQLSVNYQFYQTVLFQSDSSEHHSLQDERKVLLRSFHLNVHNIGFHPQTQKIEPLWSV